MAPSIIDINPNNDLSPLSTEWISSNGWIDDYRVSDQGSVTSTELIKHAFETRLESLSGGNADEDAFFVADLGEVYRQHLRWKRNLPRVKPFYAVKCNPDAQVINLLAGLGTGFDCASKAEIKQVLEQGVAPSRIIYAHPCKTRSYIRYAATEGVKQMTFDNADELQKVKQIFPDAELFLRIMTDDSSSLCRLSVKFGAPLDSTRDLLELAWKLDLNVVGVSFHVGSGASDPTAFLKAVQDSRVVFDQAADVGFKLKTLDVGGGFSGDSFESMASVLSTALDEYFPSSVRVIAEPGRFYVASAFTIATNVIARRTSHDPISKEPSYMLYLNDGVYGNFSSIMFDHQHPVPHILLASGRMQYEVEAHSESYRQPRIRQYSLWGPTCDGIDCISHNCCFVQTLDVGDWLYFKDMGAYTKCSATNFNGFTNKHDVIYVSSEVGASTLLNMENGFVGKSLEQ